MRKDVTKQEAVEVLSDEIFGIQRAVEKVDYIMQEVVEDFFSYENPEKKTLEITWDYPRYAAMSDVVYDYIAKVRDSLKELDDLLHQKPVKHTSTPLTAQKETAESWNAKCRAQFLRN